MVVVKETVRVAPQNNVKPETSSLLLDSDSRLPAAPASSNTTTTTIKCPECGNQRVWKDGIRYRPYGEIQRYICRNCSYRFSHSDHSEPSERLQKLHTLILKSKADKPILCRVVDERNDSCKELGSPQQMKHIRSGRATVLLTERAKKLVEVETRIQEKAAGATPPTSADIQGKIIEVAWRLKKEGYSPSTIITYPKFLKLLIKHGANLHDPESVKDIIAQQETWGTSSKLMAIAAYTFFASINGIHWEPPKYTQTRKLPFIPLESEIDTLIAKSGKKIATILQLLKETGMRIGEAYKLTWIDIDLEHNTITVNAPEKAGNPRMLKISNKLAAMLNALPKKGQRVFEGTCYNSLERNFHHVRKRAAEILKNPRLLYIHFHTLRHWKATMEYHKTKDILYLMKILGHKRIENTLLYTQLVTFEGDEFHVKAAKTLDEACKLAEAGFEYFTTIEGVQIFRKRK